jgi:hypothetical protein
LATRPKSSSSKKASAKKARKRPVAKKAKGKKKSSVRKKKKSASRKKSGKKKASQKQARKPKSGHRKGPRKASAARSDRRPSAPKSHAATIAKLYPRRIGSVMHYYAQSQAALIKIETGEIEVGDAVHIHGHTTDFYERIEELRIDDQPVQRAKSGQTVGIKLSRTVRENDGIYLLSN